MSFRKFCLVLTCLIVLAVASFNMALSERPGTVSEVYLNPPFHDVSYICGEYNSTFFYAKNQTTGNFDSLSSSDDTAFQYAINNVTVAGGSVLIISGTYSVTLTLKTKVYLIIDKGATGITVSINAGATCTIEDRETGYIKYYAGGSLVTTVDYASGNVTTASVNVTTIYATTIDQLSSGQGVHILKLVVENGTSMPSSPVERQIFFRSDQGYLYVYNNSVWIQVGTTSYSNLTGTPDLTLYLTKDGATALTGNWNAGGSYGIYGLSWINCTALNATGLWWVGSDPSTSGWGASQKGYTWFSTADSKIKFWDGSAVQVLPSVGGGSVSVTMPYTYRIYASGSTYYMEDENGNVDFSNTNASQVWFMTIGNCSDGDSIFIKNGVYTVNNSWTDGGKNNIKLELDSGAHIVAANNFNNRLLWLSGVTGWHIIGGEWDGNQANQGVPNGQKHVGIQIDGYSSNCTIERTAVHNIKQFGIWIMESSNCVVSDSDVYDIGWNGMQLGDYSDHLTAVNCRVWDCGDIGIDLMKGNFLSAIGNHVWNMTNTKTDWRLGQNGIEIEDVSSFCTIQGNTIENVKGNGIQVHGNHNLICNNVLNNTDSDSGYEAAIYCAVMNNSRIANNIINAPQIHTEGIWLQNVCCYNVINDNTISVGEAAIVFLSGCDYNWVAAGNDMRGSADGVDDTDGGVGNIVSAENLGA